MPVFIQEPWSPIACKVICTCGPLNNFQQGLICISDSKTTSVQVISTLLPVLQQCTSKHFTHVDKNDYWHIIKRGEKRRVPSWWCIGPFSRQRAELRSLRPKSGAPVCEAPSWLNKSPVPALLGGGPGARCRIPPLGCSTDAQHCSLAVRGHLNFSFL